MELISYVLLMMLLLSLYAIYNLDRKHKKYQAMVEEYDRIVNDIREYMDLAIHKLIQIDRQQIFEGDDDVGWFFKSLKTIIIELNNNITGIVNEETDSSEENKKA